MFTRIKKFISDATPRDKTISETTRPQKEFDEPLPSAEIRDAGISLKKKGNEALAKGKISEAAMFYLQAVEFNPDDIEGHINLGYVFGQQKRYREAQSHLEEALRIDPSNVDSTFILANLSLNQGNHQEANRYFNNVLALNPNYEITYRTLNSLERYGDAVECCDAILRSGAGNAEVLLNRGIALQLMSRHEDALADFSCALLLKPNYPEVHFHMGASYKGIANLVSAAQSYRDSIRCFPNYLGAHNNLGTILLDLNRYEEALECFNNAIRIEPENPETYLNQGAALLNLRRHRDALSSWALAAKLKPDLAEAHFYAGQCLIQLGEFESGWKSYEWRWRRAKAITFKRDFGQPLWSGNESLSAKTILLHHEQGLGDTIQFCRYAKKVADLGATVLLLVPRPLLALLSSLEGVSELIETDQPLPAFDFHCPLLSLPLAFETRVESVPADIPYISSPTEIVSRIRDQLAGIEVIKIGMCWKGGVGYVHDADRSPGIAPFESLLSRFSRSQARFYPLLPNSRDEFVKSGGEDLGYELDSSTAPFVETAALIMNLDLVITCDTSIGHLAGALGKPVWLVLPFSPDWRWINNREDSPWYPNTRLFRQNVPGDWSELFDRVSCRLTDVLVGSSNVIWPPNISPLGPVVVNGTPPN